ncbi:6095_t:CDS:2, partial [Racocetra persica]
SAQTWANSQGYVLVKKKTRKNQYSNLKNIALWCDWGGIYSGKETLLRQTTGSTLVEALIDELREGDYMYEYKCDDIGHITHLFFAYNESVLLTRRYSSVILMD